MRLAVAIQHHPKRAHLLPRLLASLEPLHVEVIPDPEPDARPSPWRTYEACLRYGLTLTDDFTHLLVLQDDVVTCRDFAPTIERAIAARPDRLLLFSVCGNARMMVRRFQRAAWNGESWATYDASRFLPTIAACWPAEVVGGALDYVDEQTWSQRWIADDEIAGRVARGLRQTVLATVPSLVQHPDAEASLIGRRARGGRDPGRVAISFIGDTDADPLAVDWRPGPL